MEDTALRPRQAVIVDAGASGTRIELAGDVDVSLAPRFAEAVATAERAGLPTSVDASGVTFMDSSGIALLARLATRTPKPMRVIDPPEVVRFLLEVTRIGDMVEIVDTEATGPEPSRAA